ncbi:HAD superfamily hydrolase (TIGR01509 family) [Kutzneria buriramensis]|uniref:HAD superfamily hydrolase (TIGR01509 family) n=2 Tax=Kutzneria buriramensis TaxID=1045776 RepID=A0A3E0IAY2_9PSEU|nr:HAD superfamily hydrolase (TIGR01509 family) [Kutzneria buriramensis]
MRGLVVDFGGVLTDRGPDGVGEPPLIGAVLAAREAGIRTALLSNADGPGEPIPWLDRLFQVLVFSGDVGVAKPDVEIYRLTVERLGLAPAECVFVDDLAVNVRGAVRAGLVGVHHTSVAATLAELSVLLGVDFAGGPSYRG